MSERTPEEHPITEPIPPQPEQDSPEPEVEEKEEETKEPKPAERGGQTMKSLLLAGAAAVAFTLGVSNANAVPIAGGSELSLNGSDNFTGAIGGTTFTINFTNPANVGGQSGSFSIVPNCTGCVTMINTLTQASANFQLYSLMEGAVTSSLTAGSISTFQITAGAGGLENLDVSGPGTLNLTGFDPTPGFYSLTTQGPSGTAEVTFSNTAIAQGVPEPGTLAILGAALVGFFGLRKFIGRRPYDALAV